MRKQGELFADCEVDVAFHDVDLATVVWHGHYFKYLENARWALMRVIGYEYQDMIDSGYGWPVIEVHVKYIRAARFGERLQVRASLVEWDSRLTVNYLVKDARSGERVARGQTIQAAIDMRTKELLYVLPDCLTSRVTAALARQARQ
jgi:acyl-CoA thioester hydrolase